MKRILILAIICFAFNSAFAQADCNMCGDWYGNYESFDHDVFRVVVRINKLDDTYHIRQKYIADNGKSWYYNNYVVTRANDNEIYWYWDTEVASSDNPRYSYLGGRHYYCVKLKGGVLYYAHLGGEYRFFDKNMNFIYKEDFSPNSWENKTLYKNESDW